jgi:hypothetical protein
MNAAALTRRPAAPDATSTSREMDEQEHGWHHRRHLVTKITHALPLEPLRLSVREQLPLTATATANCRSSCG